MDPIAQFQHWWDEAKQHPGIAEPTAMTLATATADGKPSARIVLLKQGDADGFTFFTNYEGRKSVELASNPQAALLFYWMPLDRQVRIEGRVQQVSAAESDAYFASRARDRQIGAWASQQSRPLATRNAFDAAIAALTQQYEGKPIPRPPHWGGWRLVPEIIEFWQQCDARLHVRDLYRRRADGGWDHSLLYP